MKQSPSSHRHEVLGCAALYDAMRCDGVRSEGDQSPQSIAGRCYCAIEPSRRRCNHIHPFQVVHLRVCNQFTGAEDLNKDWKQ